MRSVAPQSLLRNLTQMSLLVRCLRFFISLYWKPMVAMTHHKIVAKDFQAWPCLPDNFLYIYSAVHIQAPVQGWNKVDPKETLCVPSALEVFLMALQKGYFHQAAITHYICLFFT